MDFRIYIDRFIIYIRTHVWLVAWAITVFLLLVSIFNVVWQNYRINQDIDDQKQEIAKLESENGDLKNLIAYLQTDSFKEKEARRKLNYQKPGEKVLLIPRSEAENLKLDVTPDKQQAAKKAKRDLFANWRAWEEFLFK
jgi:cell division protein FtsB